jgi:hypothetical protein
MDENIRLFFIKYTVEWLVFLLRIREVTGSNAVPEISYPDWYLLFLSLSRQKPV